MGDQSPPYVTIRARQAAEANPSPGEYTTPSATHDISRVSYHVKHIDSFAKTLEDSATRAFPNRGRSLQRYKKVQALLLHWKSDDLFVLPELEDLERTLRDDYNFETDIFPIPSENAHLELMLKVGALIKEHESNDTLFVVYYGGHAKIDESRQSTWCATRHSESPWLQWSAIQTLLERSASDTLILLDCCAGAASATFPNGKSITETISASSWDAIAPDPGRYSFTNALIEVLGEWRLRTFSAAMLHAEVLARLKHPRPITINGKHFEARSTPVHFMMTANHKAPSIELGRIVPSDRRPPSPPMDSPGPESGRSGGGRGPFDGPVQGPNEDEPHVMISLALEDDQRLDLNAWEQWLASFPALAKYVKVQGVFKSHSTLLLLSMPVMVWDLLPEDRACSFVAFIRSNNLLKESAGPEPALAAASSQRVRDGEESGEDDGDDDRYSIFSGTTYAASDRRASSILRRNSALSSINRPTSQRQSGTGASFRGSLKRSPVDLSPLPAFGFSVPSLEMPQRSLNDVLEQQRGAPIAPLHHLNKAHSATLPYLPENRQEEGISRTAIMNLQRSSKRTLFSHDEDLPDGPPLSQHIVDRLEEYFQKEPNPTVAVTEFFASNLGIETRDIDFWFHRRRQQQLMTLNLRNLKIDDHPPEAREGAKMILPGHLNTLLQISPPGQVLLLDLRSPTDFEKSHIYGAVNLRVPDSLVQNHFELIDRAFTDDHSRRNFSKWSSAKCVVLYDRVVEFPWECPIADSLYDKFKQRGWQGQVYILKGHYREFSNSFDEYVAGDKMTRAAKEYIDGLRERSPMSQDKLRQSQEKYDEWLRLLENEDRVPPTDLIPSRKAERKRDVEQHQAELEAELEARNPVLYRKVRDLRPAPMMMAPPPQLLSSSSSSGRHHTPPPPRAATSPGEKAWENRSHPKDAVEPKPELVGPLSRGLDKMHEASGGGGGYGDGRPGAHASASYDKLGERITGSGGAVSGGGGPGGYDRPHLGERMGSFDKLGKVASYDKLGDLVQTDEFDDIDRDEQLRNDPAFQKAGDVDPRKAASRERPFWRRLRSANK